MLFEHGQVPNHAILVLCVVRHMPQGHLALLGGPSLIGIATDRCTRDKLSKLGTTVQFYHMGSRCNVSNLYFRQHVESFTFVSMGMELRDITCEC